MNTSADTNEDVPSSQEGRGLLSRSFLGLLITQFLGATNDNILRWLVIGIGKQYVDKSDFGLILMAGTAGFVVPYLLLAAPAGYLADRYSKRRVIVACKAAEIVIMVLAVLAILSGSVTFLLLVVVLMGAQSALFGPAKLGSIPEILPTEKISAANGLIGLTTVIATVVGMAVGNVLTDVTGDRGQDGWWLSALVLISVAAVGWGVSLLIERLPAANPARTFPWDMPKQTWRDLQTLAKSRPMLRVALGVMFFWSLGALAQLNIDQFAFEGGATEQREVIALLASLVVGVGLGSVLAGIWSGGKVELGILPLGAGGVALSGVLLFTVEGTLIDPGSEWTFSYALACFFLFLLGTSAGLFDVPLASYMQHRSPAESRGSILAASNFMTFSGILVASLLFYGMRAPLIEGSLETVVASTTDESKQQLAHSLWDEMSAIREADVFLDLDEFLEENPEDKQLVRAVYNEFVGHPLFSSRQIFLICGIATFPVFFYILWRIPQASIRFLVWLATHTVYRVRVNQRFNLPETGGALLVANHVSWLDGLLLLATSSRPIRILIQADWVQGPLTRTLARVMGAIPIKPTPKATRLAIETAREALNNEELVCIFPEGSMTRTGQLRAFKPGMMQILSGARAPVIPVYLDELWGSIFSYRGGRLWWQWPRHIPSPVSIWFGKQIEHPGNVLEVRQAVQDLGAEAVEHRKMRTLTLPREMLRRCRGAMFRKKVADSSGAELSGGSLLMRSLILRRLLLREVLGSAEEEPNVGILIPPSVGAVVVNAAVTLANRTSANLNYTVTSDVMNACIRRAGIRHVLTSRKVMEKLDLEIDAELIYLEDFKERVTGVDKLVSVLSTYATPSILLERLLGLTKVHGDDVMTIIFTSGSTGEPKGVMLTHHNVASNVAAINDVVHLRQDDTVLGVLPFFHSFGYTVTLWTALSLRVSGVYHFSPLDAKQVGKLAEKHKATVILSTPTFLRSYIRRCSPESFDTFDVVVVGAERMPIELADAFEEKFGMRPVEGYGATELSPLVSVNVPPSRSMSSEVDCFEGTVGRAIPGVSAKVVHPETWEDLPLGTPGMLLVKGPNVMRGYLGQPEKTSEVIRDGWYVTGDIAMIDDDAFITITGRVSRFSKIGGEMVPHIRVEEELQRIVTPGETDSAAASDDGESDAQLVAVTSAPDERKGERLVVIHVGLSKSPEEICRELGEAGLPNLWIPSPDSFHQVEQIPMLGTGKVDLKSLKDLALEVFGKP